MRINPTTMSTTSFHGNSSLKNNAKKSFNKFVSIVKTICKPIPKEDSEKMYQEFKKNWILYR